MNKILELDITEIWWNLTSLKDIVIKALKERELYKNNNTYRGFNKHFFENVLAYGSENCSDGGIYALSEHYLSIDPDPKWSNPLSYARASGALAVFNGNLLKLGANCFDWYEFIDQPKKHEALSAVFLFQWRS